MKIILLHGDDSTKINSRYQKFIDVALGRKMNVERLDKDSNIIDSLSSQNLFSEKILYVLNDAKKLDKKVMSWIKENYENIDCTLVIVNEGTLGKAIIDGLPKDAKVEEYTLPVYIWNFLESFYPGNAMVSLKLFTQAIKNNAPEFIFVMLSRHLRDLYMVKLAGNETDFPAWRLSKLKNQLNKFENGDLENIIGKLSDIDIKTKSSKANIKDELDFLIASRLK